MLWRGIIGVTVGTLGFTGEKKKELVKKTYNQQIPLASGVVGELKGEFVRASAPTHDTPR